MLEYLDCLDVESILGDRLEIEVEMVCLSRFCNLLNVKLTIGSTYRAARAKFFHEYALGNLNIDFDGAHNVGASEDEE